jgi:hypothetical protein
MSKFRISVTCFLTVLLAVLVTGCGQQKVVIPGVLSSTPAQGSVNVPISTVVTVTLSVPMKPSTINSTDFILTGPGGIAVAGVVTYSSTGSIATFTPNSSLAYSTLYTATLTTGAKNPGGTGLLSNYVWSFTTITPPPVVASVLPLSGALNVPISQAISATFNETMLCATLVSPATNFTVTGPGSTVVNGTVTCSGTVATFTPTGTLTNSTLYTATIHTGAESLAGTGLLSSYVWTFTTITPVPTVISTVPITGATGVPVAQVLTANFSEPMLCTTLTSPATNFTLTGPGLTVVSGTVICSGTVATFTPSVALTSNTLYTATVSTGAASLAGTGLATNYVWTFTTSSAPAVTSTVPLNGATGVPVTQVLTANFNQAMLCTTLTSPATNFTLTGPGSTAVTGTVNCSGSAATFMPNSNLANGTLYTATIKTGAESSASTPLAANYVWSFTTAAVTALPTVTATVPGNLATDVPLNQKLLATFSEAMAPATISATTFTLTGPGTTSVTGVVTYLASGSNAIFVPSAALTASTLYTATITTGVTGLDGTAMASNYVWTFTTGVSSNATAPTVLSTIPANAATNVPTNQIVLATFSKAMNPLTINGTTFTLLAPGAVNVSGLVAYSTVSKSLTFAPTVALAVSTLYTATITTGATDLTGNALASNYVWTFTTSAVLNSTHPEIVSTVPVNLATGVAINQPVSATFTEAMNPLTINTATFQLTGSSGPALVGTVKYDPVNFIATFTPFASFATNATYTATITGATDQTGNTLGTTGVANPWTFTTGTGLVTPSVSLGAAASFGTFGGTAGITNSGNLTVINGDIGTTAVSTLVVDFHDGAGCSYGETPVYTGGLVNGTIFTAAPPPTLQCVPAEGTSVTYAVAQAAAAAALTAYNTLVAFPVGINVSSLGGGAGELGNRVLAPGVYTSAPGSYAISAGPLTLDAQGNPNAVWIFQMATSLTVGTPTANESIVLVNGAQAKNVFWQVGSAATINGILGGGTMVGTIIAQSGVSISTAGVAQITTLNGRALSLLSSVTMVNTVVNVPAP